MPKDQSSPRPWYIATLGGMASYLEGATMVSLSMAVILLQKQLGLSAWSVGALSASLTLSFSTGAIVGGRLGDLFGRRVIYSADLVIYALGALIVILSPNQAVLFAGVIVTGLAMGADIPASLALVAEEAPPGRQGAAVAYSQTLLMTGVGVSLVISNFVADTGSLGARLLFGHLLVVSVIVWVMRRGVAESSAWLKSRAEKNSTGRRKLKETFRKPHGTALLATTLFFVIGGIMPNTLTQFGPYLIVNLGHSTMQVFSTIGTVTFVVGLVIALLLQRFADTKSRTVCLALGLVALVIGPLVAILGNFSVASLTALFILNTIAGSWAGDGMYRIFTQEIFPTEIRSTSQGFTYGMARYCMAGFGLLTPALVAFSPTLLMLLLIGLGLAAAAIGLLWLPRIPRHGLNEQTPVTVLADRASVAAHS
ncbi:MFS transporter [Streptomyces sp. NBC_00243]|uniref:MFS transporter n=1 Tax=Streptomyces sp. NBC_00243 TaxID=2975688 RepID=UPI002DDA18BF|nr:MFS transporter [Streptomyces sp. NBC_00243]WRZ24844.1 MFS transporter [Streptomyces sp. NBC_00243]